MIRIDLCLEIEAMPGAEIGSTAKQAQRIADMLGAMVKFRFNGVTCIAYPGGDAAVLSQRQQDSQTSKREHKWANSRADELLRANDTEKSATDTSVPISKIHDDFVQTNLRKAVHGTTVSMIENDYKRCAGIDSTQEPRNRSRPSHGGYPDL